MDLSNLSLADLRTLNEQVASEYKKREQQEVVKAREQILAIAVSVGIPLDKLMNQKQAKSAWAPRTVMYQCPTDPAKQWNGLGRAPGWAKEYKEQGKLADLIAQ